MASTFSYAQAAKGVSTPATSKSASGSATPAKDGNSASATEASASPSNWAEDVESESRPEQPAKAREARSEQTAPNVVKVSQAVDASNVSSPDLGASTSSTVTKDDDVSSIPNTSSESTTWDNKSQASTSVDKSVEPVEKTSDKVKKTKNVPAKPLQEAPVPTVNPWKIRADTIKSQVQKVAPQTTPNGVSQGANGVHAKKGDSTTQEKATNGESRIKGRKEFRGDTDVRNGAKGRFPEKDVKAASNSSALPPPPNRDQESWPTPETVIDEDRKKAQEKGEKEQKERKDGASTSKHEWVKIPYTPTVVFNTPLPNAAGARRGGRPGGRGGAPGSGRPTSFGNGAGETEKDGFAPNGEQTRRERAETATQDVSPKAKRTGSTDSPALNGQAPVVNGDGAGKANGPVTSESEAQPRSSSLSNGPAQNGAYPRQYPSKPHKGRRGEFHGAGERRRDGASSPTKDNTWGERQTSAGTQTDAAGDGERRAHTYQDGSSHGHSKRFSSFSSGRERGGRGGRGSRGNFANGHHYTNGHSTSSFPLGPRSPTTFVPESNSFFPAPHGKFGRNSHRSQSLTTDPYRYSAFQGGYPAPIQTSHEMYPYGIPAPMSAGLPYSPYGVDQYQIFSMITAQVYAFYSPVTMALLTNH
jgi:la-related protein 1